MDSARSDLAALVAGGKVPGLPAVAELIEENLLSINALNNAD